MVYNIFSKRIKRENPVNDVYNYDLIPLNIRVQIVHLWTRAIGHGGEYTQSREMYKNICQILREEYGVFHLDIDNQYTSGFAELSSFFLNEASIEKCLDVIELTMKTIEKRKVDSGCISSEEAQRVVNIRLREGAIGYQYENGSIIKVDHQLVHSEIVKPALQFLSDSKFKGANNEFISAHANYRAGAYKECVVDCLKAFESTMKIICQNRGWGGQNETASKLIAILFEKELIPQYLQTQFNSLKSLLESGIPTIRNKTSGHGQGEKVINVPEYMASYILHQSASSILFLIKAHQAKK